MGFQQRSERLNGVLLLDALGEDIQEDTWVYAEPTEDTMIYAEPTEDIRIYAEPTERIRIYKENLQKMHRHA